MIPDLPLLRTSPLRSGLTSAIYEPRFLLTRLPVPGDANSLSEIEFFRSVFNFNATLIHERVHWLQHHGSSLGCFLEAVRYSQQRTTLRWLRELPSERLEALLSDRDHGKPILKLDPVHQTPILDHSGDDTGAMNLFRNIWWDHQALHEMFLDSRVSEKAMRPAGAAIGEVIGDVMLALCGDAELDVEYRDTILWNQPEARQWFAIPDNECKFVSVDGNRLTTRMILECAATISELATLRGEIYQKSLGIEGIRDQVENWFDRIYEGDYGAPVRAAASLSGLGSAENLLPTVEVLCFIALNPPLPPFQMGPADGGSWPWHDLYPPIRFARAASALRSVGLIKGCTDHGELAEYIDRLCDAAKIPDVLEMSLPPYWIRDESLDFSNPEQKYPTDSPIPCHDYVLWVQRKLIEYRYSSLPFLVSFGNCLVGDLSQTHIDQLILNNEVPYTHSPIHWTENDKVGYACPNDFGNWLLRSLSLHYVLFDLVAGTERFDLTSLPPEASHDENLQIVLKNSIANHLAINPW